MQLHELQTKYARKYPKPRVGRGGKRGTTSGHGTKGQKSRGKSPLAIGDRGALFLRRLPLYRGKMRNKPVRSRPVILPLHRLADFSKGEAVTVESVIKHNLVSADRARFAGVKLLGDGEISVALTVQLPCSRSARKKIEKAGGTVETDKKGEK